jgi:hypothetical protein
MPELVWQRFKETAEDVQQPVENLLLQTLQDNMPPSLADVPPAAQRELKLLRNMGDQELWEVARSKISKSQQRRHEALLEKNRLGTISEAERTELRKLGEHSGLLTLKKAYAYALLYRRGHSLADLKNKINSQL